MRKIITAMFCIAALATQAQPANTHIRATMNNLPAGNKLYLKNADSRVIDSTLTQAGRFQLDLYIPEGEGANYMLQIGKREEYPNTTLLLYLEKGRIKITGNGPLFNAVALSGSPFIANLNDYRQFLRATDDRMVTIWERTDSARRKKDPVAMEQLQRQLREADSLKRVLTGQWIEAHRSSPISVYLLSTLYFYHTIDIQEPVFKKLLPAAKNNKLAKIMQEKVLSNDLNGIGKWAPDLAQPDTLNKIVSLKDFRGKYVLLDFWASWCSPCRKETPFLREALEKYGQKNFTILSVSIDNDREKWLAAVRMDKMIWPNLIDPATNRVNAVLNGYYVPTIPANLLINPDGVIIARNLRGGALDRKLSQIL